MITPNPFIGSSLHAIGGVSAATCYMPYHKTQKWSWGTFWIVQAFFAWLIVPIAIGYLTVPNFFEILMTAPKNVVSAAFFLGALYGFGGMCFGYAILHIGYSLTYTIAIGLSAVFGTIIPLMIQGKLIEHFSNPGSSIVLSGMVLSLIGVAFCGWAGYKKETDIEGEDGSVKFNMTKGLFLAVIAGLLSAVFNISLETGQPIADMARENGAGHFEGNAKMIVSTAGCFIVNIIWFTIAGIKENTLKEFTKKSGIPVKVRVKNTIFSSLAGCLWFGQFFFYGIGHVRMGNFTFISWVLHMSMLIFFSYIVGVIMKEWKNVSKSTYSILIIALILLVTASLVISYGSYYGETIMNGH